MTIIDLIILSRLENSRSEVRRLIKGDAVKLNDKIISDDKFIIDWTTPETGLGEIVENHDHPWFVGVQFHPEYKSTVSNPHPLFISFVQASLAQKEK